MLTRMTIDDGPPRYKHQMVLRALDRVLSIPALRSGMLLGNWHKILPLNSPEPVAHYIARIYKQWAAIAKDVPGFSANSSDVKKLEFLAPSTPEDRVRIRCMVREKLIFQDVEDPESRNSILRNILSIEGIITSLKTFHTNMNYLEIALDVLRQYIVDDGEENEHRTVFQYLAAHWDHRVAVLEYKEGRFYRLASTHFRVATVQLILFILRHFPYLSNVQPLQDQQKLRAVTAEVDDYFLFLLHSLAKRLGFSTSKINRGIEEVQRPARPRKYIIGNKRREWRGGKPPMQCFLDLESSSFLPTLLSTAKNKDCPLFVQADFIEAFFGKFSFHPGDFVSDPSPPDSPSRSWHTARSASDGEDSQPGRSNFNRHSGGSDTSEFSAVTEGTSEPEHPHTSSLPVSYPELPSAVAEGTPEPEHPHTSSLPVSYPELPLGQDPEPLGSARAALPQNVLPALLSSVEQVDPDSYSPYTMIWSRSPMADSSQASSGALRSLQRDFNEEGVSLVRNQTLGGEAPVDPPLPKTPEENPITEQAPHSPPIHPIPSETPEQAPYIPEISTFPNTLPDRSPISEQAPCGPSIPPQLPNTPLSTATLDQAPYGPPIPPNSPNTLPNRSPISEQAPHGPPIPPHLPNALPDGTPDSEQAPCSPPMFVHTPNPATPQSPPTGGLPSACHTGSLNTSQFKTTQSSLKRPSTGPESPTKRQRQYESPDPAVLQVNDEPPFAPTQPPQRTSPRPNSPLDRGSRATPHPPPRVLTGNVMSHPSSSTGQKGQVDDLKRKYMSQQKGLWQRYFRPASSEVPSIDKFLYAQGRLFDEVYSDVEMPSTRPPIQEHERVFNLFQSFRPTEPGTQYPELPDRPSSRDEFYMLLEELYERYPDERPTHPGPEVEMQDRNLTLEFLQAQEELYQQYPSEREKLLPVANNSGVVKEVKEKAVDPWSFRDPSPQSDSS